MKPKYRNDNVDQCWLCKRREGTVETRKYLYPVCGVCEAAMIVVYAKPCDEFVSVYEARKEQKYE